MKFHKKKAALLVGAITLLAGLIPLIYFTYFADPARPYTVNPVTLTSRDGTEIKALRYDPAITAAGRPGIVVAHGFCGNKQYMQPISIELAKRGFTVIGIDFRGHGSSGGHLPANRRGDELDDDMIAAVEHLESLGMERIGLVGHSMGGFTAIRVAGRYPERIRATVAYGATPPASDQGVKQVSNLLLLNGKYEQIFSEKLALDLLKAYTGFLDAKSGVQYGDFSQGTAVKAVLGPASEHLLEVFDPVLIHEMVQWFEQSFHGAPAADISITAGNLVLSFFISIMGAVILIFSAAAYLNRLLFKGRERRPEREIPGATSLIKMMALYVLANVVGVLLLPLLALSFPEALPVSMGHMLYGILVGNAAGILVVYYLFFLRKDPAGFKGFPARFKIMCGKDAGPSLLYGTLTALIAAAAISSIMHWSVTAAFPTFREAGSIFTMTLLFFPFFLIKEFYFRQVQGQIRSNNKVKEYFAMAGLGAFMDNVLLIPAMLLVWQHPDSSLAFIALSLSVFAAFSIIKQLFVTWIYIYSGRNILGSSIFLCIFYAWIVVNFFPFGQNVGLF